MSRTFHVIGGGITGLAAAHELVRSGDDDVEVVLHEPGRLGGKLATSPFAGRMVDEAADAFLARVPWGRELADEVGLGPTLVSPAARNAYIAAGDDLHPLPEGLVLGVPTDPDALRGSPLVDDGAADRVRAEPTLPGLPLVAGADPSIGDLVRQRLGDAVLERLVDPLLGGINAGDSDRLSLRAAAPQLAAAATAGTSLTEGLAAARATGDPDAPVFWAPTGGMQALADTVLDGLRASGRVRFESTPVGDVRDLPGPTAGVVLAVPAPAAAAIVEPGGAGEAARLLRTIAHSSPVLVTLALRVEDVRHPLDASGFLVPRVEGRLVTACSFASTKWAHLAGDDGLVLLRASAGRFGDDRAVGLPDDDLVASVLRDLDDLLGLGGAPVEIRIGRFVDGFPQYEPGHLARVDAVEADLAGALPHVRVAGAPYRGIGVPACVRQGREAARSLLAAEAHR